MRKTWLAVIVGALFILPGCEKKADKAVTWCAGTQGHEIPDFAPGAIWTFFSAVR